MTKAELIELQEGPAGSQHLSLTSSLLPVQSSRFGGVPRDLNQRAPTPKWHNGSTLAGCRGGSRCSVTTYGARSILM